MNSKLETYTFLRNMYSDGYFPNDLVDKLKAILLDLCNAIETSAPASLDDLYALSHDATKRVNGLASEFEDRGSELETVAREAIAADFRAIAVAYGFPNADHEELTAPRDW